MTPEQLRELADKFEQAEPPPQQDMAPGDYVSSQTAHRMARFLRKMADDLTV